MRGQVVFRQKGQGKGSWYVKVSLGKDAATGRYRQYWEAVGGKMEAQRRLTEVLHQLDTGAFATPTKGTIADFLKRWLLEYAIPNLSPRTVEGYGNIINKHVVPSMGYLPLAKLKPEHLQKYYAEKRKSGLSAQTVRHHHTVLHKAFKTAMEWGIISRNVADAVHCPRATPAEISVWDEDEVAIFLDAAKKGPYYALFYTLLFTGLRRSELLALRWCDVDLILGEIHVNRSLHVLLGGKVIIRPPKTKTGKRTVSLPPSAYLVLAEHRKQQEAEALLVGKTIKDEDPVFSFAPDFKPLLPNTVSHAWNRQVRRLDIKKIGLHGARHTHASIMLKQGIHPKVVQERLGHSSIQITLDTYSHVAPGLQKAAAERFDDAFQVRHNESAGGNNKMSISSKLVATPKNE